MGRMHFCVFVLMPPFLQPERSILSGQLCMCGAKTGAIVSEGGRDPSGVSSVGLRKEVLCRPAT